MTGQTLTNVGNFMNLQDQQKVPGFVVACLERAIDQGGKLKSFLQYSGVFPTEKNQLTDSVFGEIMKILIFSIFPYAEKAAIPDAAEELYQAAWAMCQPIDPALVGHPMSAYDGNIRDSLQLLGSIVQNIFEATNDNGDFVFHYVNKEAEELAKVTGLSEIFLAIGDTLSVIELYIDRKMNGNTDQPPSATNSNPFDVRSN